MDLMEARRRMLIGQKNDSKIWLIKDGIDVISNTDGYVCSTQKTSGWQMTGWSAQMPILTQEDGFLRLSVTGNPVYGSLIPQKYLDVSEIKDKRFYLDSSLNLSNRSYFHLTMYGNDGIQYFGREIKANAGYNRCVLDFSIYLGVSDRFTSVIFTMQISTRSTSYIDIYNMWIE